MLKKIQIKGLFDRFDYDIELKEGGLTILTGPNGYGKTTILGTIHAIATNSQPFLSQLSFTEIAIIHNGETIRLRKDNDSPIPKLDNGKTTDKNKRDITLEEFLQSIQEEDFNLEKLSQFLQNLRPPEEKKNNLSEIIDFARDTGKILGFIGKLTDDKNGMKKGFYKEKITDFVNCYFIREQRLVRSFVDKDTSESFRNTIEEYAKELFNNIRAILAKASEIGQNLDGSFPERLFNETGSITEEEFDKRYDAIREKQNSLSRYGLSTIKEERHPSFRAENARALLVYLNDTEKKLAVFDEILQRLDLFSSILNKRQFVSKEIEISPEFGFQFKIEDDSELPLAALSSGEQQEVVLLYELLFRVAPNTLVLIDEPEISLHVAWQMEFLDDLLKIIELQKITVLVATHSPDIIDKHEDLVVDLWDLDTGSRENRE
uniref:Predicted ATP-binding protein involved in virulence n=1 Tax=Candidatus Kentrum sp. TC TaxID=2126339 RepID=A0A450ZPN0_9GAMM|nr:MAG: Predicted ATP-binding protein involved in virulence [Candidatus Kentron sp. TC]VFK55704.1 MAG: Predicted ATP-binding protein involved in virulence [Candidatus Kentron sp. TC]